MTEDGPHLVILGVLNKAGVPANFEDRTKLTDEILDELYRRGYRIVDMEPLR